MSTSVSALPFGNVVVVVVYVVVVVVIVDVVVVISGIQSSKAHEKEGRKKKE